MRLAIQICGGVCGLFADSAVSTFRMENREDCKKVIEVLDKAKLAGNSDSITVKFADSGSSRRKLSECNIILSLVFL